MKRISAIVGFATKGSSLCLLITHIYKICVSKLNIISARIGTHERKNFLHYIAHKHNKLLTDFSMSS